MSLSLAGTARHPLPKGWGTAATASSRADLGFRPKPVGPGRQPASIYMIGRPFCIPDPEATRRCRMWKNQNASRG